MVSPDLVVQLAEKTMKNTINNADYIIDLERLSLYNQ